MINIPVPTETRKGVRVNVPTWLSDPDGVAPCFCGQPMQPGEHHIVGSGELGMKRWFHAVCWQMMQDIDDWDDDDDDDWDDE